ncbi:MAG: RNA polymerase sigma factor [Bryobacteraceae bacterium]
MNQTEQHQRFLLWTTEHRAILHHVVNAFAGLDDRGDLMQEVLLAVWKSLPAFRGDSRPTTFLYRVSHNAAMTWRRTRSNYRRLVERAAIEPPANSADPEREERLERLYTRIREFPALDRSLLLLWLDEVSYREMAEIHGIAENLVGVRLTRARGKLIEEMKELHI